MKLAGLGTVRIKNGRSLSAIWSLVRSLGRGAMSDQRRWEVVMMNMLVVSGGLTVMTLIIALIWMGIEKALGVTDA